MNIDLVMTPRRHIVPATEQDKDKLRIIRAGDLLPCVLSKSPRNGDHHRKFMALAQFVAENHPRYQTIEDVLVQLKVRTGHAKTLFTDAGRVFYELRSISWREMDEAEFVQWSEKAKRVVFDELFPQFTNADEERVDGQIREWLAWT